MQLIFSYNVYRSVNNITTSMAGHVLVQAFCRGLDAGYDFKACIQVARVGVSSDESSDTWRHVIVYW